MSSSSGQAGGEATQVQANGDGMAAQHPLRRALRTAYRDIFVPPDGQFAALDGMRGIVAYFVVFMHVAIFSGQFILTPDNRPSLLDEPFFWMMNTFWVGLDVFFVLSGFLIGRILWASLKRTGTVEFWSFFTRRSARIFPAYYLTLTFGIFVYAPLEIPAFMFIQKQATWQELWGESWKHYFYLLNYFVTAEEASIMSQAWSLCVEEHFYVVLPPLLVLCHKAAARFRIWILLGFIASFFVIRAAQYFADPELVLLHGFYYRSHNRFDEPMLGVVLAYLFVFHHDALKTFAERLGNLAWMLGLGFMGLVWFFGGIQAQGAFAAIFQFQCMAVGSGLVLLNALFLNNGCSRLLASRFWYPVARVSYSTFLNHMFVLWAVMLLPPFHPGQQMSPLRITALAATTMVVAVLCAMVTFVTIERPLMDWGRRLAKRFRKPSLPNWQHARDLPYGPDKPIQAP